MIRHFRFQNRVAESVFTLPVCVVLSLLLWWFPQFHFETKNLVALALTLLVSYVLTETNNVYQLIRIRTRMMACMWLLQATCMPFLHTAIMPLLCALLLSVSHFILFRCYQLPNAVNGVFHCFLVLSVGSLCWSPLLLLVPFYWFCLSVFLRSMSWRTFWSSIFGILLPYWLWFGYAFCFDGQQRLQLHFESVAQFVSSVPALSSSFFSLPLTQLIPWIVVVFFVLWGLVHYLRNSYNDKIRVRMMLYIYVCEILLLLTVMILLPQNFLFLSALFFVNSSSLLAHYFSLTSSRFSNFLFCLFLLLCFSFPLLSFWLK